jgi:hypothetical protein
MDDPLPYLLSMTFGLSGREPGVLGPFRASREPLFLPFFRGQRNSGRLLGLESGLGLGLGLTEAQEDSGSELAATPLERFLSLKWARGRRGFRNSGDEGALRMRMALGSERAMEMDAVAEV